MIKKWLCILALSGVALFAACGGGTPEEALASAKAYLAKKETMPAVIQLKNALQMRPDWAEARFLLGEALLDSGDPVSAAVELRKARDLKHPDGLVIPPLARAMVLLGQFKGVTDQFGSAELAEPLAVADATTSLAVSYLAQGAREKGELSLRSALKAQPTYVPALTLKARVFAGQGNFDAALALVDSMLAGAPGSYEVWGLKGDLLLHAKADPAGALEAYRKALAIKPDFVLAHTGIVLIGLARNDLDGASQQVGSLKNVLPQHPQTRYLEAQVAFERADDKTARELTLQLLRLAPDDAKLLQLAGAIELRSGALLQAETYLQKALRSAPGSRTASLLLAQTYVRSGQSMKALGVVAPLLEGANPDAAAMSVAAEAHFRGGDLKKAEALYQGAANLNPTDAKNRTALALTHMSMGKVESGFDELQRIAIDDSGTTADLALISTHMRRKDYPAALKAVDALDRKQPGKPVTSQLRGMAELGLKQVAAARVSFERALSLDRGYFPAVQSLAALDLADKKPELAKKRFENLLVVQPSNVKALLAVAGLTARSGGTSEEVAKLLGNAVRLNPTEVAARLPLIDLHIAAKKWGVALVTAKEAVAAIPTSPELLEALGRVQWLSGDVNQAQASFNKLAAMQPNSPASHLRLADLHVAGRNSAAALQSLKRALAIKPDMVAVQRNVVMLELAAGRGPEALIMARTVQAQRPKEGVGFMIEGDLEAARKDLFAAAAAYRRGLKLSPSTPLAMKLHAALLASGKQAEADAIAASWMGEHPSDTVFLSHLGLAALERQSFDEAERHFGAVVKLEPNNVVALNNLAWAMTKLNKNGALPFAQKANALKPNQPELMGTLAAALAVDNQMPKALELQRKVVELQPGNHELRLSLAKMYIQAGQNTQAKSELSILSNLGEKFGAQSEVTRILKTL